MRQVSLPDPQVTIKDFNSLTFWKLFALFCDEADTSAGNMLNFIQWQVLVLMLSYDKHLLVPAPCLVYKHKTGVKESKKK